MKHILCIIFAGYVSAQPVPYYSRSQQANQDLGAGNVNLRNITDRQRDKLVTKVGDAVCVDGQSLVGATERKGYIFGGSCGWTSKTIAQLQVSSPTALGVTFFCSNCSPAKIVIGTGTALSNWSDAVGGAFK